MINACAGLQDARSDANADSNRQELFALTAHHERVQAFSERKRITAAQFTAIGALSDAVMMYFNWQKKDYLQIPVREQVDLAPCAGPRAAAVGRPIQV